ncbi:MAG: Tn3 family transposase [Syntrophobacteraceae bacterium]|nr:Tn3 family transposase [Syntrophobacteraceae bacterium]
MWREACRRLIKNAITCWNHLYLSRRLAREKNEERRAALIEAIRNGSVATWAPFNLHGEFDFSDERMVDSMGLTLPPKSGTETGLKLGGQITNESFAGYRFTRKPMEL